MYCIKEVAEKLVWIGSNDRRLNLFENIIPIPEGISYNSYLLLDEKTVLLDTVDRSITDVFMENLKFALGGRGLDYIVVNHMEPDHCATLIEVLERYPQARVVGNVKTFSVISQLYHIDLGERAVIVKEGDSLDTGSHTLRFYMMPMVHWPEVMATYDETAAILFTADAFGCFGTLNGHIFSDEFDFQNVLLERARRYYSNIVGKYGPQVQAALKKLSALPMAMICPLHGPVWRGDLTEILRYYQLWSTYTPEKQGVVIAYASIYGNTENAVNVLAGRLTEQGIREIHMYDVSDTDPSYILSEAFCYGHLVLASSTYNNSVFPKMESLIADMKGHNLQNRTVALLENGTWAPMAGKKMQELLESMKGMRLAAVPFTIRSSLAPEQLADFTKWSDLFAEDVLSSGQ